MSQDNKMELSNYQYKISDTINNKFIDYCMYNAKSLYNIELMYHYFLKEELKLFNNPKEHYTKIMYNAYKKTIEEYEK